MKHAQGIKARVRYPALGVFVIGAALSLGGVARSAPTMHPQPAHRPAHARHQAFSTPIQHVIVIVQENRSIDNLFNGFVGADTVRTDPVTGSVLHQCPLDEKTSTGCPPGSGLNEACDPSHKHEPGPPPSPLPEGFSTEYDGGAMDGFQAENGTNCTLPTSDENVAYSYVPPDEVTQYWGFAASYALLNHALQTNNGPSFPSHQYLIAGQAGGLQSNGSINSSFPWSIDENTTIPVRNNSTQYNSCLTPNAFVTAVNLLTPYPGTENPSIVHPCGTYPTVLDEARAAGFTWKYYASNEEGLWGGPSAVKQDCLGPNPSGNECINPNIIPCSPQALSDFLNIGSTGLANVTYVIPQASWSDHAKSVGPNSEAGPNWVTWLVNTIGHSAYWSSTTIIVTWDDWGGWFDHYQPGSTPGLGLLACTGNPLIVTPGSCGFRVPIVVIGPYVKTSYIDASNTNAAGSILLYIEHTFGLPNLTPRVAAGALGTADDWTSDDLMNTMNFNGGVRPFVPQPTSTPSSYYTGSSCVDPSNEDD